MELVELGFEEAIPTVKIRLRHPSRLYWYPVAAETGLGLLILKSYGLSTTSTLLF